MRVSVGLPGPTDVPFGACASLDAWLADRVDRDFKIGLICGAILAGVALLWVATRPTLTTQARMYGPSTASSQEDRRPAEPDRPTPQTVAPPSSDVPAAERILRQTEPVRSERPADPAPQPAPAPAANSTIHEQERKITTTRFHIVQKDETLSAISQQYYGTANQWRKILEANQQNIKDADRIRPGTKLIIPE